MNEVNETVTTCIYIFSFLPSGLILRIGSPYFENNGPNGTLMYLDNITVHPNFNNNTVDNDVAVLHLQQRLTFDVNIQPVDLASEVPAPGSVADLTGWGRTSPVSGLSWILQHTQVYIVSQAECRERYGQTLITDQMICASVPGGGRGFCTVSTSTI